MNLNKGDVLNLNHWTVVKPGMYRWYIEHWMYDLYLMPNDYVSVDVLEYPSLYRKYKLALYIPLGEALDKVKKDIFVRRKEIND